MGMQKKKWNLTDMRVVLLLASLSCFLWGSATPAIKTGYAFFQIDAADTPSIILFAGMRFLLGGFLVILFQSLMEKRVILPPKGAGGKIIKLSLAQTVGQYVFFYIGLAHCTGVHGAIVTGTNVFISVLMASLIFRYERLTGRKALGCLLGFLGIVIVNLSGAESENIFDVSLLGEGFVLLAQIFYALSGALIKKYGQQFDVVTMSGYQFMAGGAIMIVAGLASGGAVTGAVGPEAYLLLLYLALLSAVAYTVWSILLKHNPVSRVTIFGFMNPIFGVLLSAAALGETEQALSVNALIALVLVCMGICIVNLRAPGGERSSSV